MKMYLVYYSEGRYEDYYVRNLFVTADIEKAQAYADKFNKLLSKLKQWHYDDVDYYSDSLYERLVMINDINGCYISEIEVR